MDSSALSQFGAAWWAEARKKVKKAHVYIDAVSCECLHWNGGAESILQAGAACVKEFSTFETVASNAKKAVFIVGSSFRGTNLKVLETLIRGTSLEYCVLITSAHVSVHHFLQWGGGKEGQDMEAFDKLEEDVLTWMGNMNYIVEIFNYPLCTVHPTSDLFLLPTSTAVKPLLHSDLRRISELLLLHSKGEPVTLHSTNDLTFATLPLEMQGQVRQLVFNLHQLLQHLNAREEIFTVGSMSRILGAELEALGAARNRRRTAANRVSVVFVDRTLDLASAARCSSGSFYDRVLHTLPRLDEYSNDVSVDMKKAVDGFTVAAGCLAPSPGNLQESSDLMSMLFDESLDKVTDQITAALMKDAGDATDLDDLLRLRWKDFQFLDRNSHRLQVAMAGLRSKEGANAIRMDDMLSAQKCLTQLLADPSTPSPLVQVVQLLKKRKDSTLRLDDIILLLVHIYSLEGDADAGAFDQEDRLKSVLAECLVQEGDGLSAALQKFVGMPVDEIKAHRAAKTLIENLRDISNARTALKKYRKLYERPNPTFPLEYKSLLKSLVEDIFSTSATDNPDLEHKAGGLKDLIKTGFSLFVNVRKPKPIDNPVVLLFVCGGIRADEVKMIEDIFHDKSPSHRLIIGSSQLISAADVLPYALKRNMHAMP